MKRLAVKQKKEEEMRKRKEGLQRSREELQKKKANSQKRKTETLLKPTHLKKRKQSGDFNAHHGLWGSYKQNHNGVSLVEALNSADLVLLNDGSPTRFQNNENNSVVDLTFASPDIANIIEWRTHDDTLGSDHYPILLEIKLQSASNGHVITPKNKWNTDKANWNLYHHYCDNFFNNCPPAFQNTDEKYQFFIQGINEAALKSIPPYKPFTKKNSAPAPWWDQECEEAINNRKREFRKYKQQSNVENYVSCKREIAKTKRILKNKAKLYWIKYCNNLNKNTPCSDLWSQAKRMQRMQVNYNKCNNLDWEEHFFNKIAPCSTTQDSADMFLRQDCNTSSFLSQHITINELEYALRNANNSSPGLDNITPDGSILTCPRKIPKLQPTAIPTIFPNQPFYMTVKLPQKRKDPEQSTQELLDQDIQNFDLWMDSDKINSFDDK
nr:unnamed protein product [Callosobruchus analis]